MAPPLAYTFHQYRLLPAQRQLLAEGVPVRLGGRAFDVLLALVERRHLTVGKHELLDLVWPRLVVEENNLQVQMVALRKLLGHPAIATVPGRGYRFTLPVGVEGGEPPEPVSASAPTPSPAIGARLTNLPEHPPAMFGRDDDLCTLRQLLLEHPLVTVSGAGGIGKTRLAQCAAAGLTGSFAEGVWWVELAAVSAPDGVPAAVARVLGLQTGDDRDATQAVAAVLRAGPALLVLDSAEHLLEGVAAFVEALRALAPQTRLLVTSQEVLRLPGEHVMRLSTLALPADDSLDAARQSGAVALFVARAHAADPRFALNAGNRVAVIDICRRLDGIPLAIELAAARLPLLGIEGLRLRLDERFRLLTAGARAVLRRHQTLRAALEWSHGLLSGPEQVVLRRLGVFSGGFTLEGAQQVAADEAIDPWDVLEHLGGLVDKSLVIAEGESVPRYRMLETTRMFALEQLAQAGETQALLQLHALAMQTFLVPRPGQAARLESAADFARLAAELDNVRAAMDWLGHSDDDLLAVDVAGRAGLVFYAAGARGEFLSRARAFESRVSPLLPARVQGRFWFRVAHAGCDTAHPACAIAALRAAQIYRELGEDAVVYEALVYAIGNSALRGNPASLQPLLEEAQRIEQAGWPASLRANFQWAQHRWLMMQDRVEEALACTLRQAELSRAPGTWFEHVTLGANVAACEEALGRLQEAEARARDALAVLAPFGPAAVGVGHVLQTLALVLTSQGRHVEASAAGQQAYRHLVRAGDDLRLLEILALNAAGELRFADAALAKGCADAAVLRAGELRWPSVAARCARLDALLLQGLEPAQLVRLAAEGATLPRDAAFRHAFGELP